MTVKVHSSKRNRRKSKDDSEKKLSLAEMIEAMDEAAETDQERIQEHVQMEAYAEELNIPKAYKYKISTFQQVMNKIKGV